MNYKEIEGKEIQWEGSNGITGPARVAACDPDIGITLMGMEGEYLFCCHMLSSPLNKGQFIEQRCVAMFNATVEGILAGIVNENKLRDVYYESTPDGDKISAIGWLLTGPSPAAKYCAFT